MLADTYQTGIKLQKIGKICLFYLCQLADIQSLCLTVQNFELKGFYNLKQWNIDERSIWGLCNLAESELCE